MFGYVKPEKAEMLVREYEFYRATYCGICRAMKKHTGTSSCATLSYDSVFLALLRMLFIDKSLLATENRRCIAHPFKKKPMLCENPAIEYTARAFAILSYHKVEDDLRDGDSRRLSAVAVRPVVRSAHKRAGLSELSRIVKDNLCEISRLERERCESVDAPADLFGRLLGELFSYGLSDSDRLVTYQCGYHLGRFIYCADAAEDYEKDRKSGSYNPYVTVYNGEELTDERRSTIKCALLLECKALEGAVNLLPFGSLATIENIVKNIIYLGLPARISFLDGTPSREKTNKEITN